MTQFLKKKIPIRIATILHDPIIYIKSLALDCNYSPRFKYLQFGPSPLSPPATWTCLRACRKRMARSPCRCRPASSCSFPSSYYPLPIHWIELCSHPLPPPVAAASEAPLPRRSSCERFSRRFQRPGGRDPEPHPRRSQPPCVLRPPWVQGFRDRR
jgi:hypothetical protein